MAELAMAQETLFALRRKIAKMEGRLAEYLDAPARQDPAVVSVRQDSMTLRRNGVPSRERPVVKTGIDRFDYGLGGGMPQAALTEIHSAEVRKAGAAAGFVLAVAAMTAFRRGPFFWIGTAKIFRETGRPYLPGLGRCFGLAPETLLCAEVRTLDDGLWLAEEAASLKSLSAVVLEFYGNPARLNLTATRRLHHRAVNAGAPVFLLRHGAVAEPTAAPVRLIVSPAPAGPRSSISGPLHGFIGPPAFNVEISKSPAAPSGQFTLEWNSDERSFSQRQPALPGAVVPLSGDRQAVAPAAGTLLAFGARPAGGGTTRHQPSRKQHTAHRRPRRTG